MSVSEPAHQNFFIVNGEFQAAINLLLKYKSESGPSTANKRNGDE